MYRGYLLCGVPYRAASLTEGGKRRGRCKECVRPPCGAMRAPWSVAEQVPLGYIAPYELRKRCRRLSGGRDAPRTLIKQYFCEKKGKFCQTSPCICRGAVLNCPQYTARPGNELSSPYTGTLLCVQRSQRGLCGAEALQGHFGMAGGILPAVPVQSAADGGLYAGAAGQAGRRRFHSFRQIQQRGGHEKCQPKKQPDAHC